LIVANDIEAKCKQMVTDANKELEKYENDQKKKGVAKPDSIRTFLSQYDKSKSRTGEEQAEEVLAGRSWTCNSSHMADAARHVGPKLNGKNLTSMSALKKAVSEEDYDKFVEVYAAAMKKQGLRNYKGGNDFLPSSADPLHLELADSRLKDSDPKVEACRLAYAKATREDGKAKNEDYEKADKKWLEAYDKAHPQAGE
jgi:hypothetical protein